MTPEVTKTVLNKILPYGDKYLLRSVSHRSATIMIDFGDFYP
jgi:hypothetical protein